MKIELKYLDEIDPSQLAYHANDPLVSHYLRNSFPYPYTLDNALSFIANCVQNHATVFGIVVDGICVGSIGVTFHSDIYKKNCEIGYWLGRAYWGRGITTKVVQMICHHIFSNYSTTKICAEVYSENTASMHVLEKNGFEKEGYLKEHVYKNGIYYDMIIYGLREKNYAD